MSKSKVGYKKPPLGSRFKPGVSGNPKGRPKRKPPSLVEVISKTLTAPIEYHDKDSVKLAAPNEIALKRLIGEALKGNIKGPNLQTTKALRLDQTKGLLQKCKTL